VVAVVVVLVVVVVVVFVVVDTCSHGNGGCQHRCTDQSEGPACACHEKYVLRDDLHTCQGKMIGFLPPSTSKVIGLRPLLKNRRTY